MRNWLRQSVTTTGATGVGTVLSLGPALDDLLALRDRHADGAVLQHQTITDDTGAGINSMVVDGTLTYGAPDTLTITRIHETLTAGVLDAAPAAGLTLSGAGAGGIVVADEPEALLADRARMGSRAPVRGCLVNRLTATTLSIGAAGDSVWIDGRLYELSAAITTAHAASEVLAADAVYHVFLTAVAGALQFAVVKHVDATDVPQWDTAKDYFIGASSLPTPSAWRFVDALCTDGSAQLALTKRRQSGDGRSVMCSTAGRSAYTYLAAAQSNISTVGVCPHYAVLTRCDWVVALALLSGASGTWQKSGSISHNDGSPLLSFSASVQQWETKIPASSLAPAGENKIALAAVATDSRTSLQCVGWEVCR